MTEGKWLWNIGGYEYCLFWAICCLIVAMHYPQRCRLLAIAAGV